MVKEITFIIDKDGNIKIDAEGFTGNDCETALEVFEKDLGKVESSTKKRTARISSTTKTTARY